MPSHRQPRAWKHVPKKSSAAGPPWQIAGCQINTDEEARYVLFALVILRDPSYERERRELLQFLKEELSDNSGIHQLDS